MLAKYTVDTYAKEHQFARQTALNRLSSLKKQGLVSVSGGRGQKRIYTVYDLPRKKENGFYAIVNKYSPEKLVPQFQHYVYGNYSIEKAIIDGIKIGDARTLDAIMHLFRHVKDWTLLFQLAKKNDCVLSVMSLYDRAHSMIRVRKMPLRYKHDTN